MSSSQLRVPPQKRTKLVYQTVPTDGKGVERLLSQLRPHLEPAGYYERLVRAAEHRRIADISSLGSQAIGEIKGFDAWDTFTDLMMAVEQQSELVSEDKVRSEPEQVAQMDDGSHSRTPHAHVAGGDMPGSHTTRVGDGSADIPACISITSGSTLTRDGTGGDPPGLNTYMRDRPCSAPESHDSGSSTGSRVSCRTASPRGIRSNRRGRKSLRSIVSGIAHLRISTFGRTPATQVQRMEVEDSEKGSGGKSASPKKTTARKSKSKGLGGGKNSDSGGGDGNDPNDPKKDDDDGSSSSSSDDDSDEEFCESMDEEPCEGEDDFDEETSKRKQEQRRKEARRMALCLVDQGEIDMYYMLINFVGLLPWQARLLVAQHGYAINCRASLAGYHFTKDKRSSWDTQVSYWGSKFVNGKGTAYTIRLQPLQIDRFKVAAYACHVAERLDCRPEDFDVHMLRRDQHFDQLQLRMDWENSHRITEADIATHDGIPSNKDKDGKSTTHILLKLQEFFPTVCGESGIPLSYVIRQHIWAKRWGDTNHNRVSSYPGQGVDFFDFDKWDSTQIDFAAIVPTAHAHECSSKAAPMTLENYEKGKYSRRRTAAFIRDTQLLYTICRYALLDTPANTLFPAVGPDKNPCGRRAYKLAHNTYMGAEHLRETADACREAIARSTYSGETRNWNWVKHTSRFMENLALMERIHKLQPESVAKMTDAESVTAFLKTIGEDCAYEGLKVTKELARSKPDEYNDLPTVLALLRRNIPTLQGTASGGGTGGKRRVAAAGTSDRGGRGGRGTAHRDKRHRPGRGGNPGSSRGGAWGKLVKSSDGKSVTGQVEGIRYCNDCYKLMSEQQRNQMKQLRKSAAERKQNEVSSASPDLGEVNRRLAALEALERRSTNRSRSRSRSSERDSRRHRTSSRDRRSSSRSHHSYDGQDGRRRQH